MITTKALLLYRPGEACGLLESIFQPIVQACGSFRMVVTFGSQEYSAQLLTAAERCKNVVKCHLTHSNVSKNRTHRGEDVR